MSYRTKLGAVPIASPGWTAGQNQDTTLIDCDVHHNIKQPRDLLPYLPKLYQEHLIDQGLLMPSTGYFNVPFRAVRPDLHDHNNKDVYDLRDFCYDYQMLKIEHLDRWNIDCALLTGPPKLLSVSLLPDPDFAAALCRAFNDWTLEQWNKRDHRLATAILVSASDPAQAALEVQRLGTREEVVAIILSTGSIMPYGNRFYHPLWEACENYGLSVVVHTGGAGAGTAAPPSAAGYPTYYMEERMNRPAQASAHAASLICEGVFEKFPKLKFAFIEVQQHWAIGLMWHMDADWKSLREQTPWLKKLPSQYFREHIRVGSQPLHEPEKPIQLVQMLEDIHADETLIYCSDFPHFDWDDPVSTFPELPKQLHKRIFCENAKELFKLKLFDSSDG